MGTKGKSIRVAPLQIKKGFDTMNEKIIQIIPAPASLMYAHDGGKAEPVACLALVDIGNGETEIQAMGIINHELFEDVVANGAIIFMDETGH